ncbi:kinase-like protein [Cristinia sonorae]|uniref:Kinase-like protein n=1 Tax=Cristinia sonorae TaxID=1940300 RepID=A0A8K0XKZ8_9AGAR|nr:kinase-like protein [Cristinia sonorae]
MQAIDKTNASVEEDARIPSPYSSSAATSPSGTPLYPGWVTELVSPIQKFLTDRVDPRSLFVDLQEIAEGESGSVFSARVVNRPAGGKELVAIKNVTLVPSGTPKLADLARELTVLQDVSHPHILCMDALYVDFDDDALWIRMELMDRSLADVIAMIEEGVMLQEKHMALVAKDVLSALDYMRRLGIAHRDVRSDNLLISPEGLVRIADFSNAVRVPLLEPSRSDPAGVPYWQAPEVRSGTYNALKVDVWSLGATLWEVAETVPPFSDATDLSELGDRWPPLSQSEVYSRSFHDFLHLCSEPSSSRPDPHDLFNTPFIRNAGNRSSFLEILAQCKSIELSSRRQSTDTIS